MRLSGEADAARGGERGLDRLVEEAAVEQAGQRVAHGGVADTVAWRSALRRATADLGDEQVADPQLQLPERGAAGGPGGDQDRGDLVLDAGWAGDGRRGAGRPGRRAPVDVDRAMATRGDGLGGADVLRRQRARPPDPSCGSRESPSTRNAPSRPRPATNTCSAASRSAAASTTASTVRRGPGREQAAADRRARARWRAVARVAPRRGGPSAARRRSSVRASRRRPRAPSRSGGARCPRS